MDESEREQVKDQLKFVKWLKSHKIYNEWESAATMQKMHRVWKLAIEEDRNNE